MGKVVYLSGAVNEAYSKNALDYIRRFGGEINSVAQAAKISAGAIAGAMAEENTAYGFGDIALDKYAKSGFKPDEAGSSLLDAIAGGPLAFAAWEVANAEKLATNRTHAEWQALYTAAKSFSGMPSATDKLKNPALIDSGLGNFKISTAIDLVIANANKPEYESLKLTQYLTDYQKLVSDLMSDKSDLTVKLYALYMKENAEPFFVKNNAYGGQWSALPQTLRDALLVTYTNIGEEGMIKLMKTPYEPQPALKTGGGINHLFNAIAIGSALSLAGYGADAEGASDFSEIAKSSGTSGLAARYALSKLRYVSIEGIDYSSKNASGELDLYNPVAGTGQITDQWIEDRSNALIAFTTYNKSDRKDNFLSAAGLPFWMLGDAEITDAATGKHLTVDGFDAGIVNKRYIHFGDDKANTLTGASKEDHLYGGSGADTLEGKDGADYLEGGADADTYVLQTGLTGIDTLVDSGANTLQVDGKPVSGAFALVAGMGGDIYYSADKSYQLRKAEEGVWRLAVKNAGTGQYSAVADLKGWKDGDYGLTIGAPTQEPERIAPVVYPNSNAYLAMDGAAAPKGVTFGGGNKSDSFNGSAFDDVITTGGGLSNYVMAYSGDDMVVGGDGKDFIRTGQNSSSPTLKDNDIAFGGENRDVLMGGGGDDQLWGEYIDSANEAAGADSGEYGDWVSGELGNDTLHGSRKGDVLFGGAGQDIIKGGAGNDLILGDGHYTPFSKSIGLDYAESLTQSFIWDNAKQDMVKVHPSNYGLHPVTIASGQAFNWTWAPTAQNDYELKAPVGLISDKRVAADGGDDRLFGGEGDDWMAGQTGSDTLFGGDGDDIMYGDDLGMADADAGQDLMYGDAGNDKMYGGAKNDIMDGGEGNDKLYGEAGDDFLLGAAGDDELSGNEGADTLDGGAGADRLLGGEGDDQLWGGDGDDILDGGTGADRLHGGRGKDQLQGGAGDDTYLFDAGDDAGVVSTATDSDGNNTVELSGGALKDMQLTGSDSAWLLRYTKDDSVQLNGTFNVQWGGRKYTLAELAKAIADANQPDTPPPPPVDNRAPSVATPLKDATVVEHVPLVLLIPEATFTDPDKADKLTYSASLVGGAALPAWLVFDAPTRTLRGTPDGNAAGTLQVLITATDPGGLPSSTANDVSL